MYPDIIEHLAKLIEINQDIADNINSFMSGESMETSNNTTNGGDTNVVGDIVTSLNELDTDKSKSLIDVINTISELDVSSTTTNATALQNTISTISNTISTIQLNDDAIASVDMLASATKNMIGTSSLLAISSPLLAIGVIGAMALIPTMWALNKAFSFFDKESIDNMSEAKESIRGMGFTILLFSGSLALATMTASYVYDNLGSLMGVIGFMGLSAIAFSMIGAHNDNINKGSLAILGMSLTTYLFSLSIAETSKNLEDVGIDGMLMLAGVLTGTGLIYAMAGKMASNILMGSLAFAGIGLSLMLLSSPLVEISTVLGEHGDAIWKIPAMLTGMGLVYAGAGTMIAPISLGAVAIGLIGGSLWAIGKGLQALMDADMSKFDPNAFTNVMGGLVDGFSKIGILDMVSIPLKIPVAIGMAMAVGQLGSAVGEWKKNGSWTQEDANSFSFTMSAMVNVFTSDVDWDSVENGIDATIGLGENLVELADGVRAWETIDFDINAVKDNVSLVLSTLPTIFAEIGKMDANGDTWFDFSGGDVERGINSSMRLGKNLVNLADGVRAWETIDFDINLVKDNVTTILTTLPTIFAQIGKADAETDSWFDFSGGEIERGISVSMDLGDNLTKLADGIKAWETIDFDIDIVKDNIKSVLETLPDVFAQIGKADAETDSWFDFSGGEIERGITLVTSLSTPLAQISESLKIFDSLNTKSMSGSNMGSMVSGLINGVVMGIRVVTQDDITTMGLFVKPFGELTDILPEFSKNLEDTITVLNTIDDETLERFQKLTESMESLSKVKSINLKNNNIATVTHEVIQATSPKLPKIVGSRVNTKPQTTNNDESRQTPQNNGEQVSLLSSILSTLDAINSTLSENAEIMQDIKTKMSTGVTINEENF